MGSDTSETADDPVAQTETDADIEAEHRRAQESGEVFEGDYPDGQ